MTIAAGFVYEGGILMCADSEMSSATVKRDESKIRDCRFADGVVVFGFSGIEGHAAAAIDQCEDVLRNLPSTGLTHQQIVQAIRGTWADEYKTHGVGGHYDAVIAVHSRMNGLALYSTTESSISRVRKIHACVGVGSDLTNYVLRNHHVTEKGVVQRLAVMTIGWAKRYVQGCSGWTLLYDVQSDGSLNKRWDDERIRLLEGYTARFEDHAQFLLTMGFSNIDDDENFENCLATFDGRIREERQRWKAIVAGLPYSKLISS
jgi:hypothetical protein